MKECIIKTSIILQYLFLYALLVANNSDFI